ncbi:MAG: glutamine--fructose-6-phosphate transaminase (isomerizing) [Candidatus Omnitrophica bacterium]|nr:glutamine--fructose-6-phosphate transaminase (isomerizing) [Candidatus Omnitrophota bacterium]
MCGIVGYIGKRQAQDILLNGLKRLEYRGYDSAGMCMLLDKKNVLSVRKLPGKVKELEKLLHTRPLPGKSGLSHCRWATHGAPNQINAHPHLDCKEEIALVHNGIIENYAQLKEMLIKEGHKFKSGTDTEVIVHLIEKFYKNSVSLEDATRKAVNQLEGSFAIGVISSREPGKMVGARNGSPLVIGVGKGENFLASDISALLEYSKDMIFIEDKEMVLLTEDTVTITNSNGETVIRQPSVIEWDVSQAQKAGWPHFMLKEINEQPKILDAILNHRIRKDTEEIFFEESKLKENVLSNINEISIIACGTAYHAGLCSKYVLEHLCKISVTIDVSSEFRYRDPLVDNRTLIIAISQSGETADTLAAVAEAKKKGAYVVSICNILESSLARASDSVIYTHAGPEISVASTKAYTAQLAILYLFALYLGKLRKTLTGEEVSTLLKNFQACPAIQENVLKDQSKVKLLARRHSHFGSFLFLGRNINYPSALEGALKLKEISYIPAEGYAAGEMKHGPISLVDEYRAVVCIAPHSKVYEKMISNIQEIRSRQGKLIVIATAGDSKIKDLAREIIYIPEVDELFSPLIVALPLQLLAYHIAVKRGCDVDQPRNLAKSVTVE